jgi:uncharacterized protein DUF3592
VAYPPVVDKIFLTVGGVVLWLGCLWVVGINTLVVRFTGEHTTGTVVEIDRHGTKHAEWSFPVGSEGGYARASQQVMLFLPEVGETGTIIYDPADPQHQVAFGDFPGPFELMSLGGILFTGLILLGMRVEAKEAKEAKRVRPAKETTAAPAGVPNPIVRARAWREDRRREADRAAKRQRSRQRRLRRR